MLRLQPQEEVVQGDEVRIVLDTNVLVAGLLSPFGPPAEIVRMVSSGELDLCFDPRILTEYREVLIRPKFPFESVEVDALLDQIQVKGHLVFPKPLAELLPDPDDLAFLEVALAGRARCLITGNLKHYPAKACQGIWILSPREFIEFYRKQEKE